MGASAKKSKSKSKKAASEPQAPSGSTALEDVPLTQSGEPLFFIDLLPTRVNPYAIAVQGHDTTPAPRPPPTQASEAKTHKAQQPPGAEPGMNRDARRRLAAIEKFRQEAKRALHIPEDSNETTKELENRVAAWTKSYDTKKQRGADKKHARRRAKEDAAQARQSKEMRRRSRR